MSFQIALVVPRYCPVTDAYLGAFPMPLPEYGLLENRGWALERARYLAPYIASEEIPVVVIDENGKEIYSDFGPRLPEVPALPGVENDDIIF